jgi:hypothetical protein
MESTKKLTHQSTCVETDCDKHVFYQFGTKCLSHLTAHLYSNDSPRCDYIECDENIGSLGYSRELDNSPLCHFHTYEVCQFPDENGELCHNESYEDTPLCEYHGYFVVRSYYKLFDIKCDPKIPRFDNYDRETGAWADPQEYYYIDPEPDYFLDFMCKNHNDKDFCQIIIDTGMETCGIH